MVAFFTDELPGETQDFTRKIIITEHKKRNTKYPFRFSLRKNAETFEGPNRVDYYANRCMPQSAWREERNGSPNSIFKKTKNINKKSFKMKWMPEKMYSPKDVDQGWAWLIMLCSFFGCFVSAGMCYSLGVYYTEYLIRFPDDKILISILTGIPSALFLFLGPVSVYCSRTIGYHWTVVIGCTLGSLGYFLSYYFVNDIKILTLTHGLLVGAGSGMLYSSLVCVLKLCFIKRYVLATAFCLTGLACGCLAFPFIYHNLIGRFGLKGSLLVNAAIYLHVYVIAAILAKPSRESDAGDLTSNSFLAGNLSRKNSSLMCMIAGSAVMVPEICKTITEFTESIPETTENEKREAALEKVSNSSFSASTSSFVSDHHSVSTDESTGQTIAAKDNYEKIIKIEKRESNFDCSPSPKNDATLGSRLIDEKDSNIPHEPNNHQFNNNKNIHSPTHIKYSPQKELESEDRISISGDSHQSPNVNEACRKLLKIDKHAVHTIPKSATFSSFFTLKLNSHNATIPLWSIRMISFITYGPFEQASCIIILIMISKFAQTLGISTLRSSMLISWVGVGELFGCLSIVLWGWYYSTKMPPSNLVDIKKNKKEKDKGSTKMFKSHNISHPTNNTFESSVDCDVDNVHRSQHTSQKNKLFGANFSLSSFLSLKNLPAGDKGRSWKIKTKYNPNESRTVTQPAKCVNSLDNGSVHTGIFFLIALVVQTLISAIFLLDLSRKYWYFCCLVAAFGYFYGIRIALLNSLIIDMFGSANFTFIYSLYFFVAGIGCLLSLPLATWLSVALSDPFAMFYITTSTFVVCVITLSIACVTVYRNKWLLARNEVE